VAGEAVPESQHDVELLPPAEVARILREPSIAPGSGEPSSRKGRVRVGSGGNGPVARDESDLVTAVREALDEQLEPGLESALSGTVPVDQAGDTHAAKLPERTVPGYPLGLY
jgi:hypothetical protein